MCRLSIHSLILELFHIEFLINARLLIGKLSSSTLAVMLKYLYTCMSIAMLLQGVAQDTNMGDSNEGGIALIHSFDRKALGGGFVTTDIDVMEGRLVLAANQSGVLAFDGGSWSLISMPNRGVARSLVAQGEEVWVGGQGFFGKLLNVDAPEWLDYTQVIRAVVGDFDDIWKVSSAGDGAVFIGCSEFVGRFGDDGEFQLLHLGPIENSFDFHYSGSDGADAHGFACQVHDSLYSYNGTGELLMSRPVDSRWRSVAHIHSESELLITHTHGVFEWVDGRWKNVRGQLSDALVQARANSCTQSSEGWLIGTAQGGVLVTRDFKELRERYQRSNGLLGNSVMNIEVDRAGNAWVASEGAVNLIRFSWPQRVPSQVAQLQEAGYSSLHLDNGDSYWGTSRGVRFHQRATGTLTDVQGIEGQIWSLQSILGRPWVSQLDGAGWLSDGVYQPIVKGTGVWEVTARPDSRFHYAGTFQGLMRLDLSEGTVVPVAGFSESSRFVVFESNRVVWVAYPYKGVYRIELDETGTRADAVRLYAGAEGLPEPIHVEVFEAAGEAIFSTNDGFYRYVEDMDRLEPALHAFSGLMPQDGHVQRLYEGEHAKWWFVQGQSVGQIHPMTKNLNTKMGLRRFPLSGTPMVAPFERLELLPEDRVCVPVEDGFLYLDANRMAQSATPPAVEVRSVIHLNHESGPQLLHTKSASLPSGSHALEIRLRGLDSRYVGIQRYQWRLDGDDAEWSRPQESARITLGGLGPGTHRISFRTIVDGSYDGPISTWKLNIAPPWHGRWDVRLLLLSALAGGLFVWFRRKQRTIKEAHALQYAEAERQRAEEARRFRQDLESSELKLEAERLRRVEAEVSAKNQELASATMHLVQKAQMASTLQSGLQALRENLSPGERKDVDRLLSIIAEGTRLDENWEQFTQQFDQVHVEFHQRLLERFPDLTKNDLKLCTYLRMNLSSKEIASLTFVTVRAVEVSRSRLRKRLDLGQGENLLQFIQSL